MQVRQDAEKPDGSIVSAVMGHLPRRPGFETTHGR